MKKVMFLIVGMLFSVSVNAATLTLTSDTGSLLNPHTGIGETVKSTQFADEVTDTFKVFSDVETDVKITVGGFSPSTDFTSIGVSISGGDTQTITEETIYWLANIKDVFEIVISDFIGSGDVGYTVTVSAIPVPAALFLFAPALLGFFSLRRKATAVA